VPGLTTITAPPDNGQATAAAVADAWKRADGQAANTFVLVSVPSPDTSPTALLLSRTTRRAVLAATAGATRFQDAQRTAALLRNSGVEVVAAILLNGRPPNAAG
jgi:hypothetical protein